MFKLIAITLFAVLATGCATVVQHEHTPSPMVIEVNVPGQGMQPMLVQKLNENSSIWVSNPKRGCAAPGTVGSQASLLMYYTEAPKKILTAVWQVGMPAPQSMPAWAAGYGAEMCKWYNLNYKM